MDIFLKKTPKIEVFFWFEMRKKLMFYCGLLAKKSDHPWNKQSVLCKKKITNCLTLTKEKNSVTLRAQKSCQYNVGEFDPFDCYWN
jgi:hypothetical protein